MSRRNATVALPLSAPLTVAPPFVDKILPVLVEPRYVPVIDAWFFSGCRSKRDAAVTAGFEAKQAHTIFGRRDVKEEIARRMATRATIVEATEERIIAEYSKIAFANLGDLLEIGEDGSAWLDMGGLTPEQKAAVAEYNVETYQERTVDEVGEAAVVPVKKARIKFHDKKAALDALARIRGMFKDRVEVSGSVGLIERIQRARQRVAAGDPEAD